MATFLTANLILQKSKTDHLRHVSKLNVCGAQVAHIHVLRDVFNAEVLSLSVNSIEDLEPLSQLQYLRELYLRKNNIQDLLQVLHLSRLPSLACLGLAENPISSDPSYRRFVIAAVPTLVRLDEADISQRERADAEAEFPDIRLWDPPAPMPIDAVQGAHPGMGTGTVGTGSFGTAAAAAVANMRPAPSAGGAAQRPTPQHFDASSPDRLAATSRSSRPLHPRESSDEPSPRRSSVPASSRAQSSGWDDIPVGGGARRAPMGGNGGGAHHNQNQDQRQSQQQQQQQQGSHQQPQQSRFLPSKVQQFAPQGGPPANHNANRLPPNQPQSQQQQHQQQQYQQYPQQQQQFNPFQQAPSGLARSPPMPPPQTGPSEEAIVAAMKMLARQLSPAGLADLQHFLDGL